VPVYFCDSSAIAKRYVLETGSGWIKALSDQRAGHSLFIARITEVEIAAAIARRLRAGSINALQASAALVEFQNDLVQLYRIVEISPPLLRQASQLVGRRVLRAYDAVQLAAAIEVNARSIALGLGHATLISADQGLNAAATAESLLVEDPHLHP
jgi:predicted nucleic acid-binding protein